MEFRYSDKVKAMRPSIIRELLKQTSNPGLISFAGGNPDPDAFPAAEIRAISDELLRDEPAATLQYSVTDGYPPLIEAGRAYLAGGGVQMREDDKLIIVSGSQQVMDFMVKLLCNEGDVVAVEDPAFLGALNSFRGQGAKLVGVEMEEDGVNLVALEAALASDKKPKFFYTIPNFQNPTGATTSLEKRKAVYALCSRHGVPILEDDPYGALRFAGEALPPIKQFDEEGLVIYAASMSKVLAPGMRVAFCVGPAELLGHMVVAKQGNDVHTNLWAQRVCERFLTRADMGAHLARLQGIYRAKAQLMADEVQRQLGASVHLVPPQGGMFLWPTLPEGVDGKAFAEKCLARKLAVVPGNAFFVDEAAPCRSIRLNFSGPSKEQIVAGVEVMAAVLEEMQG